jgi:O-glycosyl hydrolase
VYWGLNEVKKQSLLRNKAFIIAIPILLVSVIVVIALLRSNSSNGDDLSEVASDLVMKDEENSSSEKDSDGKDSDGEDSDVRDSDGEDIDGKDSNGKNIDEKEENNNLKGESKVDLVINVEPNKASTFNGGRFEGWGTSLCWWANRIGYSDVLAEKAATLFYDQEQGLGLNIGRYNIGGGDDPSHNHILRTDSEVPGYLYWNEESQSYEYDWDADYNQRNVVSKILEVNKDAIIEGFSNSPPYFMTYSGCSSGSSGGWGDNLRNDQFEEFAAYLADVALNLKEKHGISFQSISPMNEPYTNYWHAHSNKQEGCHFSQGESQSRILIELRKALDSRGLDDIIIAGTDETSIDTQIDSFKALSPEAKEVVDRIDTHTYGGSNRAGLKALAENSGKNLWMSEVDGGHTTGENAGEMGAALWLAQRIIDDMNGLMPSAWILWQVIDSHISKDGYNGNRDTGMVNISGGYWGTAVANHDTESIILTRKYYGFGQFTRYIRPGFTIIASSASSLAAYDRDNNRLVIVAINTSASEKVYDFDLSGFDSIGEKVEVIRTSGNSRTGENWKELDPLDTYERGFLATLKENSITTFILDKVIYSENN